MLLTRPVPPVFLLPDRGARRLYHALAEASTGDQETTRQARIRRPVKDGRKRIARNTEYEVTNSAPGSAVREPKQGGWTSRLLSLDKRSEAHDKVDTTEDKLTGHVQKSTRKDENIRDDEKKEFSINGAGRQENQKRADFYRDRKSTRGRWWQTIHLQDSKKLKRMHEPHTTLQKDIPSRADTTVQTNPPAVASHSSRSTDYADQDKGGYRATESPESQSTQARWWRTTHLRDSNGFKRPLKENMTSRKDNSRGVQHSLPESEDLVLGKSHHQQLQKSSGLRTARKPVTQAQDGTTTSDVPPFKPRNTLASNAATAERTEFSKPSSISLISELQDGSVTIKGVDDTNGLPVVGDIDSLAREYVSTEQEALGHMKPYEKSADPGLFQAFGTLELSKDSPFSTRSDQPDIAPIFTEPQLSKMAEETVDQSQELTKESSFTAKGKGKVTVQVLDQDIAVAHRTIEPRSSQSLISQRLSPAKDANVGEITSTGGEIVEHQQPESFSKQSEKAATAPPAQPGTVELFEQMYPVIPSATSLYATLFPEEQNHTKIGPAVKAVPHIQLQPFNWNKGLPIDESSAKDASQLLDVTIEDEEVNTFPPVDTTELISMSEEEYQKAREQRANATVIVLEGVSENLEDSDFYRVTPKGQHIEGWTSGIIKVIQGREANTMAPLPKYYIIFADVGSARAYHDQILRLHKLASRYTGSLLPGYISPRDAKWLSISAEDGFGAVLQAFSLVPGHAKLKMAIKTPPFAEDMQRMLRDGGHRYLTQLQAHGEGVVKLSLDTGMLTGEQVRMMLDEDGRRRNLMWNLVPGTGIQTLGELKNVQEVQRKSSYSQHYGGEYDKSGTRYKRPANLILSFMDRFEARRFVREWHRRPVPSEILKNEAKELGVIPNVIAEYLW